MREMVEKLNKAAEAYYNGEEIMSNKEYDALYDKLVQMEKETGIVLPNSPTQKVGAGVVDSLKKVKHEFPALSLDKTKDADELVSKFEKGIKDAWNAGYYSDTVCLMWKLDGCTVVATYNGGKLVQLATRGNGEIGSDITHNATYIKGLPKTIPYQGKIVVRGEALMSYAEFNRINEALPAEERFKNPRNLCNATIQALDSSLLMEREICFKAHKWVYVETGGLPNEFASQLFCMKRNLGFDVVEYSVEEPKNLAYRMSEWEDAVKDYPFPVDGLVVAMQDTMYADTLPGTGHNPNVMQGYAFKWQDETAETVLRDIEWSASRTGLLNPVAVFDPVELCGTTVSRASLHNLRYIMDKDLRLGDRITVYKANMIIPQLEKSIDAKERNARVTGTYDYALPKMCPVCKDVPGITYDGEGMVQSVICNNPFCPAKMIHKFVHFCERDCMNIVGMSEETIRKFTEVGIIKEYKDFFTLPLYEDRIVHMEGFGRKSYEKLVSAAENAMETDFVPFVHALGIPNIGKGQAKLINKYIQTKLAPGDYPWDMFVDMLNENFDFTVIDGIGQVLNDSLHIWYKEARYGTGDTDDEIGRLLQVIEFNDEKTTDTSQNDLEGKTFVITGSLNHFKNRDEMVELIESRGGKVSGSVSSNTTFLINNDAESNSGKNKKAKELNIPIISEEDFLTM